MENFEDEDDTHFCNKCHSTINGLDSYVRHRQSGCRTNVDVNSAATSSAVSYPEILNADAFFSSLELQSSAKQSHPRRSTDQLNVQLRRSGRNLERKKRQRKDKSPDEKDESKEKLPNLLSVDVDFDELGLPSLGFPEIVASTSTTSKPSMPKPKKSVLGSKGKQEQLECKRQHDDHGEHSDWLDDNILTGLEEHNESENKVDIHEEHLDCYEDYDYQHDDEFNAESIEHDVGESDTYWYSDDQDNEFPPRSYTGGKWKPSGTAHEDIHAHDDDDDEIEQHHHEHPPPTYTGGKWKPSIAESIIQHQHKNEEYDSKDATSSQQQPPPPGHTRGKWVPGARGDITAGYWCSPCSRRLASRLVYERHLLSVLHARRSIQEIDDSALQIPLTANAFPLPRTVNLSQRQKDLALKKSNELHSRMSSSSANGNRKPSKARKKKQQRQREKQVLTCETCRTRVRRGQMGKHLLSHYHCRISCAQPSSPEAQRFLLENMANIVRQCPFQCASCRFYCNTMDTFLRHWRSDAHKDTVSMIEGSFVCTLCDFWCDDNESVEAHIMKQGHQDAVSMINGSVPIVIRRQRALTCSTCCRRFRYNIQLRHHAKENGHDMSYSATDDYQFRIFCNICGQLLRSLIALQRHQLICHKAENNDKEGKEEVAITSPYFCSFCSLTFKTSNEAILHRRTLNHKETVKSKKSNDEITSYGICSYCEEEQTSLSKYKHHLLQKHSEACHRCAKCGELFALSQDVAQHTRENRCVRTNDSSLKQWKCTECPFASESQSEYMFHKIFHSEPVTQSENDNNEVPKYACTICNKIFIKKILREHLRQHTGEKPFPCGKCGDRFIRRSTAKMHQKNCGKRRTDGDSKDRKYECNECGDKFYTKHILRQHMLRHYGKQYKCGLPGCPTILRTEVELNNHRKLVHESSNSNRNFKCNNCSYAGKTKIQLERHRKRHAKSNKGGSTSQSVCPYPGCHFQTDVSSHLRRHFRLHTGQKPYKCRHCSYASNNLENLRKHVLLTSKHFGKTIYQCESCENGKPFETNFSKELRAHLLTAHSDKYPTPNHATAYVSSIFNVGRSENL